MLRTQPISARFSEPMDAFYIEFTPSFSLTSPAGPVAGSITVSPDGRELQFEPAAPLDYGAVYTATFEAGTLSASGQGLTEDYEWSFTTESPVDWEWSDPENLAILSSFAGFNIGLDDNDNSCAVWSEEVGSDFRIIATRSVEGGAWESPVPISSTGMDAYMPCVGIDGSGQVLAVWVANKTIWASSAGLTGPWQVPQPVLTSPNGDLIPMDFFVDAAGNALLFYYEVQSGPVINNVSMVRFDPVNGWESPVLLPIPHLVNPRFTMTRSGFAAVVWSPADAYGLYARRYFPGAGWTATETVDAPLGAGQFVSEYSLALNEAGEGLVVWLRRIAGGTPADLEMYTARCAPSGGWTSPLIGPGSADLDGTYPKVALSQEGLAIATWRSDSGDACWMSFQPSGGDWSLPQTLEPPYPGMILSDSYPHFRVDGRAVFIGVGIRFTQTVVVSTYEFDAVTGWSGPTILRESQFMTAWVISRDADGRAALLWVEDFTDIELRLSRYH